MSRAATGHVRKLASGRWQARFQYPDGVRRPAPTTFQTKRDANAWCAQQAADVSRGLWVPADGKGGQTVVKFEDYAAKWLKNRKVKGRPLAARTVEGYQDLLDRFLNPTFGPQPVHTISREQVNDWYETTATETPTYQTRAYSLLRSILGTAVDDGYFALNPARIRGAGQTERRHTIRPATLDELDALVTAMPERYRLLVLLAAWTGLRFGELTELRRGDVDTREGIIRVRRAVVLTGGKFVVKGTKSAAGERDVTVPPHIMSWVRDHLLRHTAPGADGLLFPSANDETRHLRQSALTRVFYPAREKAGRPDLRFHDLRHTGLTMAAQAGATLAELKARAGHSTSAAALRYQHAAQGRDAVIAARLSEMAGEPRRPAREA